MVIICHEFGIASNRDQSKSLTSFFFHFVFCFHWHQGLTINDLGGWTKYRTRFFFLVDAFLKIFPGGWPLRFFSPENGPSIFFPRFSLPPQNINGRPLTSNIDRLCKGFQKGRIGSLICTVRLRLGIPLAALFIQCGLFINEGSDDFGDSSQKT